MVSELLLLRLISALRPGHTLLSSSHPSLGVRVISPGHHPGRKGTQVKARLSISPEKMGVEHNGHTVFGFPPALGVLEFTKTHSTRPSCGWEAVLAASAQWLFPLSYSPNSDLGSYLPSRTSRDLGAGAACLLPLCSLWRVGVCRCGIFSQAPQPCPDRKPSSCLSSPLHPSGSGSQF